MAMAVETNAQRNRRGMKISGEMKAASKKVWRKKAKIIGGNRKRKSIMASYIKIEMKMAA
jgi:hypothetical protein